MVTSLRRGLPRVAGGEPWPPGDTALPPTKFALAALTPLSAGSPSVPASAGAPVPAAAASVAPAAVAELAPTTESAPPAQPAVFRRGLPRLAGGEPWPSADAIPHGLVAASQPAAAAGVPPQPIAADKPEVADQPDVADEPAPATSGAEPTVTSASAGGLARRGLPREAGGEPWPPEGTTVSAAFVAVPAAPDSVPAAAPAAPAAPPEVKPVAAPVAPPASQPTAEPVATPVPQPAAAPAKPAVTPAARPAAKAAASEAKREPTRYGPFTLTQWIGAGAVIALAIVGAVTLVVLATRWFLGLEFMQPFMASYPGQYALPESAPVGFPGWLGWQHFFNVFLIVLIIRSGLQVRNQERPEAYWASKRNPKKISINLWLHQSLNILWVLNGAIFLILLFATGQWMRVIPTSIEVFPNAISAMLQYLSLDWPVDNGWANYNSLQQLAYFATIFIAAPLSAITGYRMSESWPKDSKLSARFPVQWARAVHFPVMIYFVAFIIVHVALVFTTGALRNLNHMYAAQGSVDPTVYANNWVGFWLFVVSMVAIAGAWIAARPLIMAPLARIFGQVTSR